LSRIKFALFLVTFALAVVERPIRRANLLLLPTGRQGKVPTALFVKGWAVSLALVVSPVREMPRRRAVAAALY
jgi:hypothetical protein